MAPTISILTICSGN